MRSVYVCGHDLRKCHGGRMDRPSANSLASSCCRFSRHGLAICAVFALLAFAYVQPSSGAEEPYVIFDVQGTWRSQALPSRLLEINDRLLPGTEIRLHAPSSYGSISALRGGRLKELKCERINDHDCSVTLPENLPFTTARIGEKVSATTNRIVEVVMKVLEDDVPSVHISRGALLLDGVVAAGKQGIDLRPVFKNVDTGCYILQWEPISSTGTGPATASGPMPFRWDPAQPVPLSKAQLPLALHELMLVESLGDEYMSTGVSAWVLIVSPDRYTAIADAFEEAVQVTQSWGAEASSPAVRRFLRAYLIDLADRLKK